MLMYKREEINKKFPILRTKCDTIFNPVSCDGVMGKGYSAILKEVDKDMHESYKNFCFSRSFTPGKIQVWNKNKYWKIINAGIKSEWRDTADQLYFIDILYKISNKFKEAGIENLAMPKKIDNLDIEALIHNFEGKLPNIVFY